jgi:hypothetical protein
MADNKMHLGHSPLTGRIYLGRQKDNHWVGQKRDVTNEFLQVMEQKFPINTSQNISVDGVNKYRVIILDMEKEITIDGKPFDFVEPETNKAKRGAK